MNRHDQHDDQPVEHDPTGIRALLSSLPDPGPMPPEVVTRITAALAREAQQAGIQGPAHADRLPAIVPTPDPLDELAARRRRRRVPWFAAAAAVAGITVVGASTMSGNGGSWLAGLFQSNSGSASSASSESYAASDDRGSSGAMSAPGTSPAASVIVTGTGTAYAASRLASQVSGLRRAGDTPKAVAPSPSSTFGSVDTADGARDCATTLGVSPSTPIVIDVGSFEGQPAAVVVTNVGANARAWVVTATCQALAGPVAVR